MIEQHSLNLYLVRHGIAKDTAEDPQRSLTENGRKAVQQVAALLIKENPQINQIRHSGKKRAMETAEIFSHYLSPSRGVTAMAGLAPNDDVNPIAEMIAHETSTLMLVGHLPFMSRLASLLLLNNADQDILHMLPGTVLYLKRSDGIWELKWILTPDLVYH